METIYTHHFRPSDVTKSIVPLESQDQLIEMLNTPCCIFSLTQGRLRPAQDVKAVFDEDDSLLDAKNQCPSMHSTTIVTDTVDHKKDPTVCFLSCASLLPPVAPSLQYLR